MTSGGIERLGTDELPSLKQNRILTLHNTFLLFCIWQGKDGQSGINGKPGTEGDMGLQGDRGSNGLPGISGALVNFIP